MAERELRLGALPREVYKKAMERLPAKGKMGKTS